MTHVTPGEFSFDDNMTRIMAELQRRTREVGDIRDMSEASFREWLDVTVRWVAKGLGIATAAAAALVSDLLVIGANAGTAFRTGFAKAYGEKRQIKRIHGSG